jgi:hypothetical protein
MPPLSDPSIVGIEIEFPLAVQKLVEIVAGYGARKRVIGNGRKRAPLLDDLG